MGWEWLQNRKVKLYLEVGLAFALSVMLGVGGSYVQNRARETEVLSRAAEERKMGKKERRVTRRVVKTRMVHKVDNQGAVGAGTVRKLPRRSLPTASIPSWEAAA